MEILQINEIKLKSIKFGIGEDQNYYIYYLENNAKKKLRICTPRVLINNEPLTKNKFINITLSMKPIGDTQNRNNIRLFSYKIKKLEKYIVSIIPDTLKYGKEFKSSFWNGGYDTLFFVKMKQSNIELIKNTYLNCVLYLDSLWFSEKKYGINWVIVSVFNILSPNKCYIIDE